MDNRIRSIPGVSKWLVFINGDCLGFGGDSRCQFTATGGAHHRPGRLKLQIELFKGDSIDIVNLDTRSVYSYVVTQSIPPNSDIDLDAVNEF